MTHTNLVVDWVVDSTSGKGLYGYNNLNVPIFLLIGRNLLGFTFRVDISNFIISTASELCAIHISVETRTVSDSSCGSPKLLALHLVARTRTHKTVCLQCHEKIKIDKYKLKCLD